MCDFDDKGSLFEVYILSMLGKIILQEERQTGRMSGLRIFCRLDVSVCRDRATGEHSFFINEIMRTQGAALFQGWDIKNRLDLLFMHMENILHLVASQKLYIQPPTPP